MAEQSRIDQIIAERTARHGGIVLVSDVSQKLKLVMRCTPKWKVLSASQKECLEMMAHKLGRILSGDPNYADSWDDIAGFAKLQGDLLASVTEKLGEGK